MKQSPDSSELWANGFSSATIAMLMSPLALETCRGDKERTAFYKRCGYLFHFKELLQWHEEVEEVVCDVRLYGYGLCPTVSAIPPLM